MPFQHLNALHERLMLRLRVGRIDDVAYVEEFDRLVAFAGWTWEEYLGELDRNWTRRRNPVRAFVC